MPPSLVVIHFNVFKNTLFCLFSAEVEKVINEVYFNGMEKAFRTGIIPAVSTAAHAWAQSVVLAPTVELIAAKLAALVRMDDH